MYKKCFVALSLLYCSFITAQEVNPFEVELNYFYGSILRHNKDITSLITGHPEGLILSYNKKT
ncbi:hypothetical protein KM777_23355, partial [Vibrio splendidus]